jgi:predicted DCC family thiol-disulfide oxidoreductase YuxK
MAATNAAEDMREESAVLVHLIETFPQTLRLSDVVREMGGGEDFSKRDAIERAVRELMRGGLLFRCSGAVLPTRAALRAYELFAEAA